MNSPDPNRARAAFVEYRQSREPERLAEVFDLAAQELLLVAHHVAGRGVSPEDLLQTTFLEAITHADQYDRRLPLMPWLCGILLNVARSQNQSQRREFDGWRMESVRSEDPPELVHAREFVDALRGAIATFPAPQREVLTLRLVHGLTPTQIAHALGHPVGSVKSWIHRGVEHLRVALPAGFAATLATIVFTEASLASVREQLIQQVGLPTGSSGPSAEPSMSATNVAPRGPLVVGGVAVVGFFVALLWFAFRGSSPGTDGEWARPDAQGRSNGVRTFPTLESTTRALPANARLEPRKGEPGSGLTIRARFAADGAPGAIGLRIEARFGADVELRSRFVETNAEGLAHVPDLPAGEYTITPDRSVSRRVDVPARGSVLDVDLDGPLVIAGRVLDDKRAPLAGACVWLSRADTLSEGEVVARTAADGTFEVRGVPPHRGVSAWAGGFAPSFLTTTTSWRPRGVDIVLEPTRRRIGGVVRNELGEPLIGARVRLGEELDSRWVPSYLETHDIVPPLTVETDSAGRFAFTSVSESGSPLLFARAPGRRLYAGRVDAEGEVVVQLEPGARWVGVLESGGRTNARQDTEVELHAVRAPSGPDPEPRAPSWAIPRGRFQAGAFELCGLDPGVVVLNATRNQQSIGRREMHALDTGTIDWSPALDGVASGLGVVRTQSGARVAGARVDVFAADGSILTLSASTHGEFALEELPEMPVTVAVRGAEGVFEGFLEPWLELDPRAEPVELIVRDDRVPRSLLVVTALDREGHALASGLLAREFDPVPIEGRATTGGRIEFGPVPQGDYYVCVDGDMGPRITHGPISVRGEALVDVGVLREKEGGRVKLRIEGLAEADRAIVPVSLLLSDGGYGSTYFKLKDGAGTSWPVPHGRHIALVSFVEAGVVAREVEVLEGRTLEHVFPKPSGTPVVLALRDQDPRGTLRARVTWRRSDGTVMLSVCDSFRRSRAGDPRRSLWNLEPGRYRIEVRAWDTTTSTAEVVVPPSGAPPTVEIELQPRR